MVDLQVTLQQSEYQQLAKDFAKQELDGQAAHWDESGQFPDVLYKKAWEAGLMNLLLPEELDGAGLSIWDICLIAEEIGAACAGFSLALITNNLALLPVIMAGNDEQKHEFAQGITKTCGVAAFAVDETSESTEPGKIETTAKLVGDQYIISGKKPHVVNGGIAQWYYVLARTDDEKLSSFIVPADAQGINVGEKEATLGWRATDLRSVHFENVCIPAKYRLGLEGDGYQITALTLNRARPVVGASAVGLAQRAMEYAVAYSKVRHTFGQPIANYQSISFMLADMVKDIQAARLLNWQAAFLVDKAIEDNSASLVAKTFSSDVAMRVTTNAVQIFGGYGYSCEYPVEKLMRDAKMFQIYDGTNLAHKVALGKQFLSY